MICAPLILADDSVNWGKMIGIVVFVVFWGISALSSMVKKANEQAKRNATARAPRATPPALPVPAVVPGVRMVLPPNQRPAKASRRDQVIPQQRPKQQEAVVARAVNRPAPPAAQPALPPVQAPPVARAGATTASKPAIAQPVTQQSRANGASAATIRRWLAPTTLRRQFILTELFQPALALRHPPSPHCDA